MSLLKRIEDWFTREQTSVLAELHNKVVAAEGEIAALKSRVAELEKPTAAAAPNGGATTAGIASTG